jgi:hypothetical protein
MEVILKKIGLLALAVVALLGLGVAACNDSDAESGVSAEDLTRVEEIAVKAQIAAALNTYRIEAIHDIDDASQKASEFDAGWSGAISRMHQVTVGTQWPEELKAGADDLAAGLDAASMALDAEDLQGYKQAIGEAHAAWHGLEPEAYAFIAGHEMSGSGDHGNMSPSPSASMGDGQGEKSPTPTQGG